MSRFATLLFVPQIIIMWIQEEEQAIAAAAIRQFLKSPTIVAYHRTSTVLMAMTVHGRKQLLKDNVSLSIY